MARGPKEILQKAKEIRAGKAEARRTERIQKLVEISGSNTELPTGQRFPIVYADPAWRFATDLEPGRNIENHYPTMSTDEICALPVAAIVTDDAALFLWTTSPHLPEALQVMTAWVFPISRIICLGKTLSGHGVFCTQPA